LGDVDFFLLDARTYRSEKTLFGEDQLQWLQNSLKNSHAAFKILAAPCVLFPSPRDRQSPDWPSPNSAPVTNPAQIDPDSWAHWPDEQANFLKWLGDNHIDGIVALAGNQPQSTLIRTQFAPNSPQKYPIFTLATSNLYSPNLAPASFGSLSFAGQRDHRSLTLRVHDEAGRTLEEQVLLSVQLRKP
jgi:phosphodiesterase/alkaline phosphatase D-like protein